MPEGQSGYSNVPSDTKLTAGGLQGQTVYQTTVVISHLARIQLAFMRTTNVMKMKRV